MKPPAALLPLLVCAVSLLTSATQARAQAQPGTGTPVVSAPNRNPAGVEGELAQIYAPREPLAPLPGLDQLFQPWYDFKAWLDRELGFRFGLAWTPLYQYSTESLTGQHQAAGGIFEFLGTWSLLFRDRDYTGTLGFRVENRHRLGTEVAPQFLFLEIGAGVPTALAFSEFDFTLAELWWDQQIIGDRWSVRFGKMLPFGFFDFFRFKNPKTGFTNAAFALNPTIGWPSFGLGVVTEFRPHRDFYIVAGFTDANGSPTSAGFDTFFGDREYFVIGDIGWDPGFLGEGGKKNPAAPDFHLTLWHIDERKKAGRPSGWGIGVKGQHPIGNVVLFGRYGYSAGGAALLEHLVMAGVAWTSAFSFRQDTLGFAASWGRPSAEALEDQFTAEVYYKSQVTRRLAFTPNIQLIVNPSANPDAAVLAVFGARVRLDF